MNLLDLPGSSYADEDKQTGISYIIGIVRFSNVRLLKQYLSFWSIRSIANSKRSSETFSLYIF